MTMTTNNDNNNMNHQQSQRRPSLIRQEMCKRAFIKNLSRSPTLKHRTQIAIEAEDIIDRIRELPFQQQQTRTQEMGARSVEKENRCESESINDDITASTSASSTESSSARSEPQHEQATKGFRPDYALGETLRSSNDMTIEPTREQAVEAVDSLRPHDFAFVKRSNGTYSYAILASRTDDSLTFVICDDCSTKYVSRKHWSRLVRLVSSENNKVEIQVKHQCSEEEDSFMKMSKRNNNGTIEFVAAVPACVSCDDCSVISDVSMSRCIR